MTLPFLTGSVFESNPLNMPLILLGAAIANTILMIILEIRFKNIKNSSSYESVAVIEESKVE